MSNHSPFPIIQVEGGPYECGLQHGDQVKAIIKETVANYQNTFEKSFNRKWEEILKLARRFLPAIEAYDPDVLEEMKGIATGSGQTFEDILVINARSELVFLARAGGKTELEQADGCTVMAATPEVTENGHMIVGHNIDWLAATQKTYIILKKKRRNALDCVTFLEAGIVGKTGFNAAGIVSFGNGMVTDKMRPGIPTQVILNKVLNAHTVAEAMELFLPPNRAGAVNRVIASAQGLCINIEAAPDEFNYLYPEDGIIVHTNHFLGQNPNIRDMNALASPNTLTRRYQAYKLLSAERGHITKETFKKIFRNHVDKPNSVCMHQDPHRPKGRESIQTVVSLILDINDFKLDIAKGPPCEHEYATLDFSDIRQ